MQLLSLCNMNIGMLLYYGGCANGKGVTSEISIYYWWILMFGLGPNLQVDGLLHSFVGSKPAWKNVRIRRWTNNIVTTEK